MATPRRAAQSSDTGALEMGPAPRRGSLRVPLLRSLLAPLALTGALMAAWAGGVVAQPQQDAHAQTHVTHTVGVAEMSRPGNHAPSRSNPREPLVEAAVGMMPTPSPSPVATETPVADPSPEPTPEPSPEPTLEPSPEPTPEPAVDHSQLGEDTVAMWAKASVNVRSGPGTSFSVINSYASGAKVTATSLTEGKWQQINMRGKAGWINHRFLSESAPANSSANTTASTSSGGSASSGSSGVGNTAQCSRAAGVERGLTSTARNVLRAVCNRFSDINSFGGARSGGGSYHSSGRAIDVMVSGERGWEVARWARENASALGIIEVIYAQKIWTTQRAVEGWRSMSNRGSDSANHYDHVHISVR